MQLLNGLISALSQVNVLFSAAPLGIFLENSPGTFQTFWHNPYGSCGNPLQIIIIFQYF